MEEKKLAVIALGGNAILRGNQKGTVEEQNQNIRETLENLIYLVREGYNLIITHGNGPQVGNILMSDDAGVKMYGLPPMTLDMCVAYSQGEIGYMIERNLREYTPGTRTYPACCFYDFSGCCRRARSGITESD